ncbi:ParB/RepB/Spo0J family partition protein [Irregularibacter muris]|uniref:ParB/RepB/Spo0J family partition protein n=1 Tax=Irregularibacter muris TaxID=1796619 RepID=A0AAE3HH08_9FIRM|nr:ParB/RepB/Spo0J family partition protein [Irregularibacter muris]MCR1899255.1 ParB/RepB/Spo0J family partition protein [Irregularibacter muris]
MAKRGLGRGLQALIPEMEEEKTVDLEIKIRDIYPNKQQPRRKFSREKLEELASSIKEHGVIQPILVSPSDSGYQIVAGERRWRAASLAGLESIPAIVKEFSEQEIMEIALIENLQREDLNIVEEAKAYKLLMDQFHLTQEEISNKLGKSRTAITNTLRLLNLSKELQSYLIDNQLSPGHGRALLTVENKNTRVTLAKKAIEEKMSVRELEKVVKNIKKDTQPLKAAKNKSPLIIELEDNLQKTLGTKVLISHGRKKGKIEIEYYSNDDLERIMEIITSNL